MRCEILSCNKEITIGKFFPSEAIYRTPAGNKKITLFRIVCIQCGTRTDLKDNLVGEVNILGDTNESSVSI